MLPSWVQALGAENKVLIDAAAPLLRQDAPSGVQGLKELFSLVDAYVFEDGGAQHAELVNQLDESKFTERAGAWLGLLLIDHVRRGAYVTRDGKHRIRLGAHGSFDPFGAITSTLEAKNPRKHLSQCVAIAEAEAAGTGPVARVMSAFERTLAESRPALRIVDTFDARVWLADTTRDDDERIEVDLHRVVTATRDQGESAVAQAVGKFLAMLPGGEEADGLGWEQAKERLLPRLVSTAFEAPGGGTENLCVREWKHDVRIALIIAYEGRSRYARKAELQKWNVDFDLALAHAVENLAERSARARIARIDTPEGPIVFARTGDGLDAARLLLPTLHEVLSRELGAQMWIATPHRDTLLACSAGSDALRQAFEARVKDDAARAPHRISSNIFSLTSRGIG